MIDALVAGRLYGKPQARTAKNGSPFAVATVRVPMRLTDTAVFVSVISFRDSAVRALLALEDGDSVAMCGEATLKTFNNPKDGTVRAGLDLVAHQVLSEYHISRKRQAMKPSTTAAEPEPEAPAADQPAQADADFNDDIPF